VEFQRFQEGQVGEDGGQFDKDGLEVDIPGERGGSRMRGSGVIWMLIAVSCMVICEPLYRQGLDALDEMGSLQDCPTPTPGLIRSTVVRTCQLDGLLDGHGGIEQ